MGKFSLAPPAPRTPEEFIKAADTNTNTNTNTKGNTDITPVMHSQNPQRGRMTGKTRARKAELEERVIEKENIPWDGFRRKATSNIVFNLRLNDYYMAILRYLAEQDEDAVPMQQIVKQILLPELEKRAGIVRD